MKMTVRLLTFCVVTLAVADPHDPTQIEKYGEKVKTYQLDVPGKEPITIIENTPAAESKRKWEDVSFDRNGDSTELKHLMTHIVHDLDSDRQRCYGPSCQDGYDSNEGPHEGFEDILLAADKMKDYREFSKERLQAINALAAKLKKEKFKADQFSTMDNEEDDDDDNSGKVFTTWNRLKVKQHKHPYDDKDGWVTLEPVAWSTSKISKWKPNVKKQKPTWNEDEDRFPNDNRFSTMMDTQDMGSNINYPQKRPILSRPGFINNKLHVPNDYDQELPSKPTWAMNTHQTMNSHQTTNSHQTMNTQQATYPESWSLDEGRRPQKPNCDSHPQHYPSDDKVFYEMTDSIVTDHRPSNFPYEYEALHQASSTLQKRPYRRPTPVVYAGSDYDSDRNSRPPYGDGQWVLLSTTKGYRNKKRQRSLNPPPEDNSDFTTMTSHQAVALTVLPVDSAHKNMTTSHGGMLEVEKSFQTVEESKRDMDKRNDLEMAATNNRPVKNRIMRRKVVSNVSPDSTTLLAAVGAGMVPATMAMVVPMMLGRRRRRRDTEGIQDLHLNNFYYRQQ